VAIDFSDFRLIDGVMLPFETVITNPALRVVTRIQSVKHKVELDNEIVRPRKEE
jgi:hypothetical protein